LATAQSSSYKPHPFVSDYMEDERADLYGLGIHDCADAIAGRLEKVRISNAELTKLVEAADYLQHCRRREIQATAFGYSTSAKRSVERASDTYDFLRGQVKL
jgi:hypothetical protein